MESNDLRGLMKATRRAYEFGRWRLGLLGTIPSLLLVAIAMTFGHKTGLIGLLGALSVGLSAFLVWYGRDARYGAWMGVATGVVPLLLSLCANGMHHCDGGHCGSWCVPACTCGGAIAGAFVGGAGVRKRAGAPYYASAGSLSLLIGAMGCACIGYSGVVGLVAGFALGSAPAVLRRVFA